MILIYLSLRLPSAGLKAGLQYPPRAGILEEPLWQTAMPTEFIKSRWLIGEVLARQAWGPGFSLWRLCIKPGMEHLHSQHWGGIDKWTLGLLALYLVASVNFRLMRDPVPPLKKKMEWPCPENWDLRSEIDLWFLYRWARMCTGTHMNTHTVNGLRYLLH